MNKANIRIAVLITLIIAALALWQFTDLRSYANKEALESIVSSLGVFAPLGFIGLYSIAPVIFFPGSPLTLLGGFIFGPIWGTVYVVIGATIGATLAFSLARFCGKDFVDNLVKGKFKTLEEYDKKLQDNGLLTMLFLRMVPLFPYSGLNYALGLTRIRYKEYILGTFIGIIPGSVVLVNIGANSHNIGGPMFYVFIALFLLLATVPTIYKKYIQQNTTEVTNK